MMTNHQIERLSFDRRIEAIRRQAKANNDARRMYLVLWGLTVVCGLLFAAVTMAGG